jgi:hypothetical protein
MSTKDVVDTLQNEVELLQGMVAYVRCYPNDHFTGSGKVIQKSWADFLYQRSETNRNVSGDGDDPADDIRADMEAECRQLEAYIAASDKKPVYVEKWRWFLECEKSILEKLLVKLDKPKTP